MVVEVRPGVGDSRKQEGVLQERVCYPDARVRNQRLKPGRAWQSRKGHRLKGLGVG